MSEDTPESTPEQDREKWLERLAGELDRIEPLAPFKILPDGIEYPRWVRNVEKEFSVALLPAAKVRDANFEITPKRMGAMIGHICEMAVWMMEWLNHILKSSVEEMAPLINKTDERPITEEEAKQLKELEGSVKTGLEKLCAWYEALRRLAKRTLCLSVDQHYQDMTDFLVGFADGFSRKPKSFGLGEIGNTTFEIYHYMILNWAWIQQIESVRQFHECLVKTFGSHRIGEQKRVEKICQRVGLSFRKPGRPKKK